MAKIIENSKSRAEDNGKKMKELDKFLSGDTKKGVVVILLLIISIISVLGFFGIAGQVGTFIKWGLRAIFGNAFFIFPLVLCLAAYFILKSKKYSIGGAGLFGLILFVLSLGALLGLRGTTDEILALADSGSGGGYIGLVLGYPLTKFMGFWASLFTLAGLVVIALLVTFNASLHSFVEKGNILKDFFLKIFSSIKGFSNSQKNSKYNSSTDEEESEDDDFEEIEEESSEEESTVEFSSKDFESSLEAKEESLRSKIKDKKLEQNKLDIKFKRVFVKVDLPIDLLNNSSSEPVSGDIDAVRSCIAKTLDNFGIPVEMGDVNVGPTVSQYTFKPSEGIKLSRITALNNDLSLALAAHPLRIEAPIPGKSLVGVEVPNKTAAAVCLREVLESKDFKKRTGNLMIGLGKDVSGKSWCVDLSRMPHLLIAGATGSGKSVCINSLIISLLYQNSPADLRLILVDPKRVELPIYNDIPHLLTPVITDVQKTINALHWAVAEMDRRFDTLSKLHYRDIKSYNEKMEDKMPYIVFVVDELADLMAAAMSDIESAIIRIAQMARAVGIHLVLATQRPSVNVITGLIKANVPARIAFSVASLVDSRTILDTSGAEKLCGRGDMLFMSPELGKPRRLQGAIVLDEEIKRVVEYLKQQAEPDYNEEVVAPPKSSYAGRSGAGFDFDGGGDALLNEAKEAILQAGKASASLLQRRLKVGYARAARILDLLEEQGFIGPADGAKPRDVLGPSFVDRGGTEEGTNESPVVEDENNDSEIVDDGSSDENNEDQEGEEDELEETE